MSASVLSLELQRKLRAVSQKHRQSLDALHEAVCDYLDNLRAIGLTQDQAVDAVRAFVRDTQARSAANGRPLDIDDAFVGQLSGWCLDHWSINEA